MKLKNRQSLAFTYQLQKFFKEALRLMNERYGDPHKIKEAKKIKDWLIVKTGDAGGFRRYSTS